VLEILLVDDEPELRGTLKDSLAEAGYNVSTASDGAEGLDHLLRRVFDIVICDVRLPRVDGLTLLRRLRKDAPDTDVILMTAYGDVSDAVAALKEGAYDYLTKPFDLDELLVQVRRIDGASPTSSSASSSRPGWSCRAARTRPGSWARRRRCGACST
jgi:two-component system, NtrC family, response regulator AtoC